jgi:hypothetical protein
MTIGSDVLREGPPRVNKVQRRVGKIITSCVSCVQIRWPPFGRTHDRQLSGARCIP